MTEFSDRVDTQRRILKAVNSRAWRNEQLFALNGSAIQRWASANGIEPSARLIMLLTSASSEIFAMAHHSDDPIAGTYQLTKERVARIEGQVISELAEGPYS